MCKSISALPVQCKLDYSWSYTMLNKTLQIHVKLLWIALKDIGKVIVLERDNIDAEYFMSSTLLFSPVFHILFTVFNPVRQR